MTIRYTSPRNIIIDDHPTPVPFWEPDRDFYKDQTVVVIGGGPSHAKFNLELLEYQNIYIITINSSCRYVMPITTKDDLLYFSDNSWNENYPELVNKWPGIIATSNRNTKARLGDAINRLNLNDLTNFMQVKSDYVQASSGHTAACLAAYMGCKRIILIGFECQAINGKSHGHMDYPMDDFNVFRERFLPGWVGLAERFKELNVEVINSTPESLILDFPFIPLDEAIHHV